jgi:hypothetical protein
MERNHLDDLGVDGKIILNHISKKWNGEWIGFIWLRKRRGSGLL